MKNIKPLLSILIPSYNSGELIELCLKSIINQTVDFEYEIIICDQSTDFTKDIIKKYCDKYDFVKMFSLAKPDLFNARIELFKQAKGKYIWYIDSDDLLNHNSLQTIKSFIHNEAVDLLFLNYKSFSKDKDAQSDTKKWFFQNSDDFFNLLFYTDEINPLWLKIYKKEIIEKEVVDRIPRVHIGDDKMLSMAFSKHIKNIKTISFDEPIYYYRINENSVTRNIDASSIAKDFYNNFSFSSSFKNEPFFNVEKYSVFYLMCLANIIKIYIKSSVKKETKVTLSSIRNSALFINSFSVIKIVPKKERLLLRLFRWGLL